MEEIIKKRTHNSDRNCGNGVLANSFTAVLFAGRFAVCNRLFQWKILLGAYFGIIIIVPAIYQLSIGIPIDVTIDRLALFFLTTIWVTMLLVDSQRTRIRATAVGNIIFLLLCYVTVVFYINLPDIVESSFDIAIKRIIYLVGLSLNYYLIVSTIKNRADVIWLLRLIVIFASLVAIFALIERFMSLSLLRSLDQVFPFLGTNITVDQHVRGSGVRVFGSAEHPIAFGALMTMILPLALYFLESSKVKIEKFWYLISATLLSLSLLFTVSRSSVIGFGVAMLILLKGAKESAIRIAVFGIIMLFVVHMVFPGLLGTFRATLNPDYILSTEQSSNSGRLNDYPLVNKLFLEKPAFGMGFELFDAQRFFHLDNQYLKLLLELGLVGLLIVLWLFKRILGILWQHRKIQMFKQRIGIEVAMLASVASYMVISMFFDTIGFTQLTTLFFIITALAVSFTSIDDLIGTDSMECGNDLVTPRFRIDWFNGFVNSKVASKGK